MLRAMRFGGLVLIPAGGAGLLASLALRAPRVLNASLGLLGAGLLLLLAAFAAEIALGALKKGAGAPEDSA
ncbi:MAG: hypothetical protein M5U26_16660 [Planctomycetota bacterium]|nr:hypothetical protein [Planctomycetota bacterium]